MKSVLLQIILMLFYVGANAQKPRTTTYISLGVTANFMRQVKQDYTGALGGGTSQEISNLYPLPGFVMGFNQHVRIDENIFFRTGIMLGYHVTAATLNSNSWVMASSSSTSENIKTRFRNLYLQVPAQIGFQFGKRKNLGACLGFKGSLLVINGSFWDHNTTEYNYDYSTSPPVYQSTDEYNKRTELEIHAVDLAAEAGFQQYLSERWILEETACYGFIRLSDFAENAAANDLKQITLGVVLHFMLNRVH